MTREQILIIHKDLLKDLCMERHNCIDCLNETTKKIYCNPYIETFYLSQDGFCIESYDDIGTNLRLLNLAGMRGYKSGFAFDDGICMLKFWKK